MMWKEFLSVMAIIVTLAAFIPYIVSILRGAVRPHVFSWVVWGVTTVVVFLAQWAEGGGVGAWPIGVSGLITLAIALLAFMKRADITITPSDWLFFIAALSSLPLWFVTTNALSAVVILTVVDVLGFGPTVRKAYLAPQTESLLFYALFLLRNVLVIMALESYSITTVLFPVVVAGACVLLIGLIIVRRQHKSGSD